MKKSGKLSGLEDHLGYWLRYVSNQVSHAFSLKLAARNVTVAEWVVLRELHDRERVAPSTLAAKLGMTRGAISKLADRLVGKSLVTRILSKDDRRYHALALTASGHSLVPKLSALADQNDAEFFGQLAPEDRAMLERTMKEIVRRFGLRVTPID